jgi:hypothetical protein
MNSIGMFADFQYDAFDWCLKNGIRIYCLPAKKGQALLEIEIYDNGRITRSGQKYPKKDIDTKIWELYCHYYINHVEQV